MLGLHSEPCSTTLRCSRPTTRAVCRRASYGADLPCKNSIQMQAAQAADCSRTKLDNPPQTRSLPFPGIGRDTAAALPSDHAKCPAGPLTLLAAKQPALLKVAILLSLKRSC